MKTRMTLTSNIEHRTSKIEVKTSKFKVECSIFMLAAILDVLIFLPFAVKAEETLEGDKSLNSTDALGELEESKSVLAKLRGRARENAVAKILANPKEANIPDLVQMLKDGLDEVDSQDKAGRALCQLGGPELIPTGKLLLKDVSPQRKTMGIRLLAASGQKEAATILIAAAPGMGNDQNVVFGLCRAFALLDDKAALPWLKGRADDDNMARLAICFLGDFSKFQQSLADYEAVSSTRQKQAVVWDWAWTNKWLTERDKTNAVKFAERMDEYLSLFKKLIGRCRAEEMRTIVSSMKSGSGFLANDLYADLAKLVTPGNAEAFLPLLEAPSPELCEEAARVLADSKAAGIQAKLGSMILAMASGDSWLERSTAMRMADLLPAADCRAVLAKGLKDKSAFVVHDALENIFKRRIGGLDAEVKALENGDAWRSEDSVRHLASLILAVKGGEVQQ